MNDIVCVICSILSNADHLKTNFNLYQGYESPDHNDNINFCIIKLHYSLNDLL
jgi:hypothetical protein